LTQTATGCADTSLCCAVTATKVIEKQRDSYVRIAFVRRAFDAAGERELEGVASSSRSASRSVASMKLRCRCAASRAAGASPLITAS
jgi:hypothetical protein